MARLVSRLKNIAGASEAAGQKALLQTGTDILKVSQMLVPVDTSSLKKSGGVVPIDSNTLHVGYGGPGVYFQNREPEQYAVHVEYGTVNSPAQPYLRPAFMQSQDTFKVRLREACEKGLT